jgi:hypothetical protein
VEVPVRDLFDAPTISELAERVEQTRHRGRRDVEQIDEMLKLVEGLSEDEIEALLAEQESVTEE